MQRARFAAVASIAVGVAIAVGAGVAPAAAEPGHGLSLEQIRGVMRANARAVNACLIGANRGGRRGKQLHGPFVYQIQVDRNGKVLSARPYQPSGNPAFDRCATGVLLRARFPGGPASVETALVFEPD